MCGAMAAPLITLRYPGECDACGSELAKGMHAHWNRAHKAVTCPRCFSGESEVEPEFDRGVAGGSAVREWKRRHDRREREIRGRHKHLGGLIYALSDDPQSTTAWAQGARGEQHLGALLDRLRDEGMAVLHDRRIPGTRANIDHIVISSSGVFVIDAKNYSGRAEVRDVGGFFRADRRFYVGGRDRTKLVEGMQRQVTAVRAALESRSIEVPVHQVICFVAADWGLFPRRLRVDEVNIVWPKALGKLLRSEASLSADDIARSERVLALALPAA
jgi:hypothetical protein